MRFSKYPKGTQFKVSVDNPQIFSAEDIKTIISFVQRMYSDKHERAQYIAARRSLGHAAGCPYVEKIDLIDDNTILITIP